MHMFQLPRKSVRRAVLLRATCFVFGLAAAGIAAAAPDRRISVFVALCDNDSQGVVPVPKAIGNGDDPERNLYWGTADGVMGCFDRSKVWALASRTNYPADNAILRERIYRHATTNAVLVARAYRGREIMRCILDFEDAVRSRRCDLAVFIGHNGLMDFTLPEQPAAAPGTAGKTDCIVLCCMSETYFTARLEAAGGRPVLMTRQLMYPGAFILHAVLPGWLAGASAGELRNLAGEAYARNQKLSARAATGVFAELAK